jgi:hypothetical protein
LSGYTIYSNIKLNFPYKHYTINDLLEFAESGKYFGDSVFIIDEIHIAFDSRSSGLKRNKIFSYFLNQSSKNDLDVYYTTQFSRQIEVRLRLNTEMVIICSAKCLVYETRGCQPVLKINYRKKPSDYHVDAFIKNEITRFDDTSTDMTTTKGFYGNPYFNLYNTREVVKLETDKYQLERLKKDKNIKDKYRKINNEISETIFDSD